MDTSHNFTGDHGGIVVVCLDFDVQQPSNQDRVNRRCNKRKKENESVFSVNKQANMLDRHTHTPNTHSFLVAVFVTLES